MEYSIKMNRNIKDKFGIMNYLGEELKLGVSDFSNWDQFEELILDFFEKRNDKLEISNLDHLSVSEKDLEIFLAIMHDIKSEYPDRLSLIV